MVIQVRNVHDTVANSSECFPTTETSSCNLRSAVEYCVELTRNVSLINCVIELPVMTNISLDPSLGEIFIDTTSHSNTTEVLHFDLSIVVEGQGTVIAPVGAKEKCVTVSMYDSYGDGNV